jgi:hypothetical protein
MGLADVGDAEVDVLFCVRHETRDAHGEARGRRHFENPPP